MGASESKLTDTINWNNLDTNEFSSNISNIKNISQEANQLLENLNISDDNITSDINLKNIFENEPITHKSNNSNYLNNDLTSSPFITSEMYNYITNKYNNKIQTKDINNMLGGGSDDISDTTSTSSVSNSSEYSSISSSEKKKKNKKNKKDKKDKKSKKDMEE